MSLLKINIVLVFVLLIQIISIPAMAEDFNDALKEAATAYSEGLFGDAILIYEGIADSGYESNELYFNLANSYYKIDDIPRSILYYERARRLAPSDEDILTNLNIASTRTIDKIEEVPVVFYKRWWINIRGLFFTGTWSILSITAMFMFIIFLSIFLFIRWIPLKKFSFWAGIILIVFTLHSLLFAYQSHQKIKNSKEAIVFTPTVAIKSSPDEDSIDLFVIHEGTKVKITDEIGEWKEIKIASGSVGWLKSETIVII